MRGLPAVRVKGASRVKCLKVPTNLKRPLIAIIAIAGRQIACTFDPLIFCPEIIELENNEFETSTFKDGSGLSSNDGSGLV
jgi:hypothetical protein